MTRELPREYEVCETCGLYRDECDAARHLADQPVQGPEQAPRPKRTTPRAVIVWRGPSRWDGAPIRVQLVLHSENRKTGDMVQAFILRDDVSPLQAYADRLDSSICGACPLSGLQPDGSRSGRACYVTLQHGPTGTWRSAELGNVPEIDTDDAARLIAGREFRIGAYGDPGMVPLDVWATLTQHVSGWTGYTHQWADLPPAWRFYLMASVDSEAQAERARSLGWRTFRASPDGEPMPGEILCPNSVTGRQCADCGACDGTSLGRKAGRVSIVIAAHGAGRKHIS